MKSIRFKILFLLLATVTLFLLGQSQAVRAARLQQQPTVSIPTVTGSPSGVVVSVNADQDQVNVRSGPGSDYPIVGVLLRGETAPAVGRSPGGDWIQIVYVGVPEGVAWIYSYLVTPSGSLPIVEPPPTPTPRVTPTIDPTLAAQFVIELIPTRLPSFTPPPPLAVPTYNAPLSGNTTVGVPIGFVIIGLGVVGMFGLLVSFLRDR